MIKNRFNIFIFVLITATIYAACRKTDMRLIDLGKANQEARFFSSHVSNDRYIMAAEEFVRGENEKYHFVEKMTARIGFPYWDKSKVVLNLGKETARNHTGDDSVNVVFIPFVRDTQQSVNAMLRVTMTPTDTLFKILCDWQYTDTAGTGFSGRQLSLMLMALDNNVFGHSMYQIIDSAAFGGPGPRTSFVSLDNNSISTNKTAKLWEVTLTVCYGQWVPVNEGQVSGGCPPGPSCPLYTFNSWCESIVWLEDDGEGSGSGPIIPFGSNWIPPLYGGGVITNPPLGWISFEDPPSNQQLQNWDDSIYIDFTVRPCIENIINKVKDIDSGTLARIITNLSGSIPGFDWEIRELPSLLPPNNLASAVTGYDTLYRSAITDLNYSVMQNATNIMIAQTIIHESVHAFLFDYYNNSLTLTPAVRDSLLGLPYAKLLKDFMKKRAQTASNYHHNLMVNNLRIQIKNALKQVCPLLGINLPPSDLEEFCSDMSWAGLDDNAADSPWSALDSEDRTRILKRLDVELNNLPGYSGFVMDPNTGSFYFVSISRVGAKTCP